jgi:hypothetical protein
VPVEVDVLLFDLLVAVHDEDRVVVVLGDPADRLRQILAQFLKRR